MGLDDLIINKEQELLKKINMSFDEPFRYTLIGAIYLLKRKQDYAVLQIKKKYSFSNQDLCRIMLEDISERYFSTLSEIELHLSKINEYNKITVFKHVISLLRNYKIPD